MIADKVKDSIGSTDFPDFCYYESPWEYIIATKINRTEGCDFGIAMGVTGFLAGIGFTVMAVLELIKADLLPQAVGRVLTIARVIAAGVLAFLFLVCSGMLAKKWNDRSMPHISDGLKNAALSGIAFSFCSIVAWVSFD